MKNPDVKAMKPAAKDDSGKASSLLCFEALCYYCLVVIWVVLALLGVSWECI